jgi:hypothetical protein
MTTPIKPCFVLSVIGRGIDTVLRKCPPNSTNKSVIESNVYEVTIYSTKGSFSRIINTARISDAILFALDKEPFSDDLLRVAEHYQKPVIIVNDNTHKIATEKYNLKSLTLIHRDNFTLDQIKTLVDNIKLDYGCKKYLPLQMYAVRRTGGYDVFPVYRILSGSLQAARVERNNKMIEPQVGDVVTMSKYRVEWYYGDREEFYEPLFVKDFVNVKQTRDFIARIWTIHDQLPELFRVQVNSDDARLFSALCKIVEVHKEKESMLVRMKTIEDELANVETYNMCKELGSFVIINEKDTKVLGFGRIIFLTIPCFYIHLVRNAFTDVEIKCHLVA